MRLFVQWFFTGMDKEKIKTTKKMAFRHKFLGASLFGIVCAATLYMVEHYRQDRRRHALAKDVARLDSELAVLRKELDKLLQQQKDKAAKLKRSSYSKKPKKAESVVSNSTTDGFSSALDIDSSDLEFYDVSDDEIDTSILDLTLKEIDLKLENNVTDEFENCLEKLKNLCIEHPENPHLLWRIGRVHFKMQEKTEDKTFILENIDKGMQACQAALPLKPELADVHKWFAILAGARSKHQPTKEKILDGNLVKEHAEKAVKLNPVDPVLHHMLGRFDYEIADLKWYERKVANALFAELPTANYNEALDHLLDAEKYSQHPWKENKLSIAKCKIKMGEIEEAVKFLEEANNITEDKWADEEVDAEIKELLEKYSSYNR